MIRKMRLKFIAINMSIVTAMLLVIFGLIFHFTRASLERESIDMMRSVASHPIELFLPSEPGENVRLPYFTVQLASRDEVVANDKGYFDLSDDEFLEELVEEALVSSKTFGVIKKYNLRYYHEDTPFNHYLVFSDMSSEMATLSHLIRTCLLLGILSFMAFLLVNILLSKWAVKPVEAAWRQQRQFVADASHELKTPLAVIMTNAELLQGPECEEESRQNFLDIILTMAHQMRGLVEQMLELARADCTDSRAVFGKVDFSRLVSDGILPFEPLFFEKGLTLSTDIDGDLMVAGDEAGLGRVLEVLLDNAQMYSREGGGTWVTLKKGARGFCVLTVANEGEEIGPEDRKNLFKRFYRGDRARSMTGNFGLGLAIADSIVGQHRGKIWAESGGGLNSFIVELPLL